MEPECGKNVILKVFTKRAVKKCPIFNYEILIKTRISKKRSGIWFVGHLVEKFV